MKATLNLNDVQEYINLHHDLKMPYEITLSNYTTRIRSDYEDLHFMKNAQSNRMFAAFSKLKKDCLTVPCPKIKAEDLEYFATALKERDLYADVIYNIDIKSAYATVLFNDGFITGGTYDYLCSLKKMERLAAVGMLAGKKEVFKVDGNGKVKEHQTIISPTSGYFFHCIQRTEKLMKRAAEICGENFLFTWVDGIYFLDDNTGKGVPELIRTAKNVIDFFNDNGFDVSFEILNQFEVINKATHQHCKYVKDGKKKYINVPKNQSSAVRKIVNFLISKKEK